LNVGVKLIFLGRVEKGGRFLKQKIVMLDVSFYATTKKKKLKRNNFFKLGALLFWETIRILKVWA
jgi:hypothetical protein